MTAMPVRERRSGAVPGRAFQEARHQVFETGRVMSSWDCDGWSGCNDGTVWEISAESCETAGVAHDLGRVHCGSGRSLIIRRVGIETKDGGLVAGDENRIVRKQSQIAMA